MEIEFDNLVYHLNQEDARHRAESCKTGFFDETPFTWSSTTSYYTPPVFEFNRLAKIKQMLTVEEYELLAKVNYKSSAEVINKYIAILQKLITAGVFNETSIPAPPQYSYLNPWGRVINAPSCPDPWANINSNNNTSQFGLNNSNINKDADNFAETQEFLATKQKLDSIFNEDTKIGVAESNDIEGPLATIDID